MEGNGYYPQNLPPPQGGGYPHPPPGGGYLPPGGGYAPQGGGYPPQGGGYPPQGGGYPPPGYPVPYNQPQASPSQISPQNPGYPTSAYPAHHGHIPPTQRQPPSTHTVIITQPAGAPVYTNGHQGKRRGSRDEMATGCCAGLCAGLACCCILDACADMDFGD